MPNSQPRIICRAGPDLSSLSSVDVNRSPLSISSAHWEGSVAVRLTNYRGPSAQEGKYAAQPEQALMQEGDTWSISFEGRWKDEGLTADDVVRPFTGWVQAGLSWAPKLTVAILGHAAVRQRLAEADSRLPSRASASCSSPIARCSLRAEAFG